MVENLNPEAAYGCLPHSVMSQMGSRDLTLTCMVETPLKEELIRKLTNGKRTFGMSLTGGPDGLILMTPVVSFGCEVLATGFVSLP